jgi:DNA-binding response OmpR family regulator
MAEAMAAPRILLIDDDAALRDLVVSYLKRNGYEVDGVGDARAFRERLPVLRPDLIVLDLMLPGEDGLSILRWLRANETTPVIIASARGEEVDRVVGLEVGADDYLPKPFGPRELLARIRAVLRRAQPASSSPSARQHLFGPWRLDAGSHSLVGVDGEAALTAGEFALLRIFVEHPNQVLSRDRLITLTKGYERSPFDRSIDVRVRRLRQKIEAEPENPAYLRTVWGEGYLFEPRGRESG